MNFIRTFLVVGVLTTGVARAADWKEPKDGVYTEKQLVAYIDTMREYMQTLKAAGKAVEGGQSGAAAIAIYGRLDTKMKATMAAHGLQDAEFNWIGTQVGTALGGMLMRDMVENSQTDMAASIKKNQDEIKEKQAKIADYESVQKAGRRIMTKDQRDAAISSAKEEQQSALGEAKQHADEAKAAKEEADKADVEAKQNDTLAKSPPADISADDKPGYIEEKKSAAESARNAAKEARDKEAEARKAEKESRSKADLAAGHVKNPDLPTTDEDKAQVKQQNADMIKQLKEEIDNSQQAVKLLQESQQDGLKQFQTELQKIPATNIDLLKKHRKEWEEMYGKK